MKFKEGDKVLVKSISKNDAHYDRRKELVGKVATVSELHKTEGGFFGGTVTFGSRVFYFWQVKVKKEEG